MPATYTHQLFTKDVFNSLDKEIQEKLDLKIFNLFGKSFDVFYFYKPKIGTLGHKTQANLYFANIIWYLKNNHETHNRQLISYLYGSICHYILDSIAHPFIYYFGGKYEKKNKKTYKYLGRHDYIELMIDAIMCKERYNKFIHKAKISKEIFPKIDFTYNLKEIIDQVYLDTFKIKFGWKNYYKSYKRYRFCFKYLMSSRLGIKKRLYKLIDFFHIIPNIKLQNHCYYVLKLDYQVLNIDHNKWYYPVDRKISYRYSFFDLYDIAVIRAVKLISIIDQNIDKDEKTIKKIIREIGNLDYGTGVNQNRKVKMKYFAN